MAPSASKSGGSKSTDQGTVTREALISGLNEDLAREYQAIIAYVVYSQVLKGAEYMNIAAELEVHAGQELKHALLLSNQLDYFNATPTVQPKPVKVPTSNKEMLKADLDNENNTIRNYRRRLLQCDKLGEYATAEVIRSILVDEQDHQIALATALGIDVPDVGIAEE
jgi:bacterioferritin